MVREPFLSAVSAVMESAFVPNNRTLTQGGYFGPFIAASWWSVFVCDSDVYEVGGGESEPLMYVKGTVTLVQWKE